MKVYISCAVVLSFLGVALSDKGPSSYAVLPYENEVHSIPLTNKPQSYNVHHYDVYEHGKKNFNFGKIMKMPVKAFKGAQSYMKTMFDDFKNKFLELNGSILRAKGYFLKNKGENMLRSAYPYTPKGQYYTMNSYTPNVQQYKEPEQVEYKAPSASYSTESGHNVDPETYHTAVVSNHLTFEDDHSSYGHGQPESTTYVPSIFDEIDINDIYSDGHIKTQGPSHRVGLVDQEPVETSNFRADRSYFVGPIEHPPHKPIPVPVPMAIYPTKLVFPALNHENYDHGGAY